MQKEYYEKNKEAILQKRREYYKKNKERIREYKRKWQRKNRNKYQSVVELKKTETWKGRKAELYALSVLPGSIDNNATAFNQEFDIIWKNKRVDVKSCNLYHRKTEYGKKLSPKRKGWWVFNKNKGDADLYFCICLVNNKPKQSYLIPKTVFNNGITIGEGGTKFNKFLYAA